MVDAKNKKLACITIQHAYEVELRMGGSNSSARADTRQDYGKVKSKTKKKRADLSPGEKK